MQGFEIALKELTADFDKLLADIPDMRRQLHENLKEVLRVELESAIASSLNDSRGTIRSYQMQVVGTKGGYAAARAVSGGGLGGRANSPGAITNYLENGHKICPRTAKAPKRPYKARIKVPGAYVSGRHFYKQTEGAIEPKLIKAAEDFCFKLSGRIEGVD